jgi:hypothetical protein
MSEASVVAPVGTMPYLTGGVKLPDTDDIAQVVAVVPGAAFTSMMLSLFKPHVGDQLIVGVVPVDAVTVS